MSCRPERAPPAACGRSFVLGNRDLIYAHRTPREHHRRLVTVVMPRESPRGPS